MTQADDLSSILLAHLPNVAFEYQAASVLVPDGPDENGGLDWTVSGNISASVEFEDVTWAAGPGVSLDAVSTDADGEVRVGIFHMSGFTIDLLRVGNLWEALEARSADSAHFLPLADPETGALSDDLEDQVGPSMGHELVVIDRVSVAPAWRGVGGVGRLLVGHALRWLDGEAQCVAVHPFPFELRSEDAGGPAFAEALAAVKHTWASIGFVPFHDSLYILNPELVAHSRAIERLERVLLS